MCDAKGTEVLSKIGAKTVPVQNAVGMVLAHDITEIRKNDFKGRAFKKGHVIKEGDVDHLKRLGKENLFVLNIDETEMHEDDAAYALAQALIGEGVKMTGETKEGKITLAADRDGLLKINKEALLSFNMLGEVMCATIHNNTVVKKDQIIGGTRAIPLVVKKDIVNAAVSAVSQNSRAIQVKEFRKPKAGVVITGNEVYHGKIKDAFAPIIKEKIEEFKGEIVGMHYAPDDEKFIEEKLKELINAGADILITTGGMSVDPDDVTRFAIRNLGAKDLCYGSAVLPGAMFLTAYVGSIPVLGIPACGMYHRTTIFDLVFPRILAGEKIGRKELAEMGHGGLCLDCEECRYPHCPFGK